MDSAQVHKLDVFALELNLLASEALKINWSKLHKGGLSKTGQALIIVSWIRRVWIT